MALKSLQSKRIILLTALELTAFLLYLIYYVGTGNFVNEIKHANIYLYAAKSTKAVLNSFLIPLLSFFLRSRFNEAKFRSDAEKFLSIFHQGIGTLMTEKKAWRIL